VSCQVVTAPAAFVAKPTVDHIKVDIKGLWHVHSSLSAPPNHGTCADELVHLSAMMPLVQLFAWTDFSRRAL